MKNTIIADEHSASTPIDPSISSDRSAVFHTTFKGDFWKPCPGTTKGYLCCGYQIITPMSGCGMYCRYCVLQAYFAHSCHIVYDNFDDLTNEIRGKLDNNNRIVRFGTGEFGDSLYNEHLFGFSRKIAALLESYPSTIVEFKTKSTNIEPLREIKNPRQVIVGFSMNTEHNISVLEKDTAPLHQRLEAARKCLEMGFHVSFHFDPMIWYDNWESDYRETVRMIFSYIKNPQKIAWVSMGGFRNHAVTEDSPQKSRYTSSAVFRRNDSGRRWEAQVFQACQSGLLPGHGRRI